HGGGRADARRRLRCRRCGSGEAQLRRTPCLACGRLCAYCEACLNMGRSRECELLVLGVYIPHRHQRLTPPAFSLRDRLMKWNLSPAQLDAAGEALRFIESSPSRDLPGKPAIGAGAVSSGLSGERPDIRNFLLWAVTGAGKTEMIFPLVDSVLSRGGRALIASPRRDVILELDPRIRRAFPEAEVVTLYGGSEQRWERGDITLSTTHQLFRFHEAFDLVILDEVDAFPYHGDPLLKYAADKSCLPGAPRLLLSATPPRDMQRAAKRGALAHARVPVRYHRHPLPEPKLMNAPTVNAMLQTGKLPGALITAMQKSLNRGAQLFVFVQKISQAEPLAALIRSRLQCPHVAATSSQDPDRAAKVMSFRSSDIRILVTTTILERGVTIPKSDVFILDADGKLFDEASLVQMAGRAGRNAADPNGLVYFFAKERNQSQLRAFKHIRSMNRIAKDRGFLLASTAAPRTGG
ncbi:DNA/RNA helicase, partial [Paenibacillus nanensis]